MKFITISKEYFNLITDAELLHKGDTRPHLLVVALKYKGEKHNFAIPLRSNIPPGASRDEYFALPPRKTTKPGHRHGLHYLKMFPVTKKYYGKFWTGRNASYVLYQSIIKKNIRRIVAESQAFLNNYEKGIRSPYSIDIDAAIQKLYSNVILREE